VADEAKVIGLVTAPSASDEIRKQIVEYLKECLDLAEKGEVDDVLIIVNLTSHKWRDWVSGTNNFPVRIGRLEIVKAGMIEMYRQEEEGESD